MDMNNARVGYTKTDLQKIARNCRKVLAGLGSSKKLDSTRRRYQESLDWALDQLKSRR